jgi:hypothetical protein
MDTRSLSEILNVATVHNRKNLEAASAQNKELLQVAHQVATESAEPIKKGFAKYFKVPFRLTDMRGRPRKCGWTRRLQRSVAVQPTCIRFMRHNRGWEKFRDGYGHDQLPKDRSGYPHGHSDGPRKLSKQRSVLRPHLLPQVPHRARMVRIGCLAV